MSDTNCPFCGEPEETDTPSSITIYRCGTLIYPNNSSVKTLICDLGKDLRREREAHNNTKRERDEAREQNANLREMAERAIEKIEQECWGIKEVDDFWKQFRAELEQLKEGAK
jgi:hypothetical protein